MIQKLYQDIAPSTEALISEPYHIQRQKEDTNFNGDFEEHVEVEESLSLEDREKELIKKALEKHRGKRKYAAQDLGISERTLYRKIKEYNLK